MSELNIICFCEIKVHQSQYCMSCYLRAELWNVGEFYKRVVCLFLVAQLCLTLCDPMDCILPSISVHGASSGKNTGVAGHAFLQGIFPTQGFNLSLLHCRWILYHLSHQGSPYCWIRFANVLLRMFASMFISDLGL